MRASRFEFKHRFFIHAVIFLLAFQAPWNNLLNLTDESTWLLAANMLWRHRLLSFMDAANLILVLAMVFMALAAWLRTWGSAYVGASVVHSDAMRGDAMLADGPYRRTRNPLYLGTLLHTIGLAILMTPSGAIFAIIFIWIFQVRLALAEEPFLAARFGQPYLDYKAAVPRFLPSLRARVAAAGQQPHWLQAMLGELYFLAAFLVVAIFGWNFNAQFLRRGILISLGVWLIVLAFMPRKKSEPIAPQPAA
jgi:protein-S-isoprenylcysteine O-methyltransferase Ste14